MKNLIFMFFLLVFASCINDELDDKNRNDANQINIYLVEEDQLQMVDSILCQVSSNRHSASCPKFFNPIPNEPNRKK